MKRPLRVIELMRHGDVVFQVLVAENPSPAEQERAVEEGTRMWKEENPALAWDDLTWELGGIAWLVE